jgi:hypothetical protein
MKQKYEKILEKIKKKGLATWYQIIIFSLAPDDTFAQRELKLFQIDALTRSCGIQKMLRRREILERT